MHWQTLPPIPTKGEQDAWDWEPTLTGMTVRQGDRYVMFYGSATGEERIGVMFSKDLAHWEKHAGNPVLVSKPPYVGPDWRDMCTFYDSEERLWHGYVCARTAGGAPQLPAVADKTLVAWVTLANTTQRGGSVLTLNHGRGPNDRFDAIVFGELEPGRWMAGSEFWRRSERDQSGHPSETAGPQTLIQIAITYSGDSVTIYREGEVYARYAAPAQQAFGDGCAVVMGLRHLGAGQAGPRFFAGSIEEARLYNMALDQATIRTLRPNVESDPRPIAQWTFEDGTAADSIGTFPVGELYGGATIAHGRLHLDGTDDYLATPSQPQATAAVAHLTSKDLLHWEYLPPAFQSPDFVDMEVPDYFELNGRHYLLFSSARSRKDTSGRVNASGTYYAISHHRDGPYHLPERPLLVGSGRGRFDNYVARTVPYRGGRLLYHHTVGGPVTWATPKIVRQRRDGTLWLEYWAALHRIEARILMDGWADLALGETAGPGAWTVGGDVVKGSSPGAPCVLWLPAQAADMMITCTLDTTGSAAAGLVWRWDGRRGVGAVVTPAPRAVAVVAIGRTQDGVAYSLLDDLEGVSMGEGPQALRLLVRGHRAEVYLNDCWLFGISLPEFPLAGRTGLLVEGGRVRFRGLRVAELEPLPNAPRGR